MQAEGVLVDGSDKIATALPPYPLRVAYDAHAFVSSYEGFGKRHHLEALLGPYRNVFRGLVPAGRASSQLPIKAGGLKKYQFWQQISLPGMIKAERAQVFLAPYNNAPLSIPKETQLVLVVHDLIPFENIKRRSAYLKALTAWRRFLMPRSIARATTVITVSEFTKSQILARFPHNHIEVIPCTIDRSWFVREAALPASSKENYILATSAPVPHKNLDGLLQGYKRYRSSSITSPLPLKIFGFSHNLALGQARAQDFGLTDVVEFLPYCNQAELQQIYRKAKLFVTASFLEGFGVPSLEALASGTPIVSSDRTSLPEVGGSAPVYFDPTDPQELAVAIGETLKSTGRQDAMIRVGLQQAEKFHPDRVRSMAERFWRRLAEEFAA
jgi:glycosyltransferase involved in cell wall biosynthesis